MVTLRFLIFVLCNFSDFDELYGRLASVVIALTFFYFTSVLIILGAQYNRASIVESGSTDQAVV